MLLHSLITNLHCEVVKGTLDRNIYSIAYDSRKAVKDSVFVAITGFMQDGHEYIQQAIDNGATVIILEKDCKIETERNITIVKVETSRETLAIISAAFYKHPGDAIHLVGITGTNGKTSTTYIMKSIFEQANKSLALVGTNGTIINNKKIANKTTTPES